MSGNVQTVDLYEVLPDVLTEVNKNKEMQRDIEEILATKHNIARGTFAEILINNGRFDEILNNIERTVVVKVVNEITNDNRVNPSNFYTKTEINKANKYKRTNGGEVSLPYTFESVLKTSDIDYLTVLSYQDIAKLWNYGILTYNFQSQRLSKKKMNSKNKIVEKADVNLRSVKNIVRLMQEGKYSPSTLLFNVLVDGKSSIEYEDGELTVTEESTINLIDGMHRVQAILKVIEENPDFEGYMNVDIKHYTLEKAQQLLAITNMVNRFDKTLIKNYMAESIGAKITKDLMTIAELKNKVSIKTTLDKKLNYYTNFAILSEAIESVFEPENTKDQFDYADVLKKFFGYMIPSYEEKFKNKNEEIKTSWFTHHNMFVGFVVIAKKLYDKYGKDYPVDEIVRIIDGIDFSKNEDSELNQILTTQGKVNSNKVKKNIREFFDTKVDELLS
ncbi:DNA sulfur modification protein DndB [Paenibacillus sp. NAIST15-1]|uniref:DNA sulfur modification protein DndB n=1 Tax=Paenibacillus sp. NAIST15-1 TaxID=1605994 RepID=UPI00086C9D7F|nr:DNA sulfur modification protein DndB [Paenibacillus sp. NAIST15-1]GAV11376.1 hypothetical protein PBN151_1303 [Paenibacillus sp. NAIST15-1]